MEPVAIVQVPEPALVAEGEAELEGDGDGEGRVNADGVERRPEKK